MRLSWHYFIPVLIFAARYFTGKKKRRTIRSGQPEDTGASRSSTSPERSDSEPSASSTSTIGNNYYVFLSFRGPDTRKGFVDHLYHRLRHEGLPFHPNFVFRDDENLRFGEPIAENLLNAIEHSKVSIPVISENYAASEWCLRELIHIMKCKESRGQIVLPVLYKVKPKDVKHMLGKFGDAFKSSRHRFQEDVKQQGPEALKKALALRVYESEEFASGHEAGLIKELVRVIMAEQQHDVLPPLPRNLVGIDDRVAEVMKLADTDRSETRIIGICGIGGIGKTTLATNIYNKLSEKFECRSFLRDIRETINHKGMEHIQSLLISDITKNHESRVHDYVMGIGKIQLSCEKKKVLILLDDVGHGDHLDKLIGGCNFESGSRIIITCRDKALLKSEYKCYELVEMNGNDSMLLFSLYAFEAKQPPRELGNLSSDIVATTGGLPLALEIIGSYLKGKDEDIWTETLEKLRKVPHMDVQKKLKLSYDSLGDQEKRMFLDIACFFIGINKRIATYLWKDLDLYPASGLARMNELSLIKYGENNELRMHDQLRDLGRDIVRSAHKEPWDWSRLWDEEAMKVLGRKEENEKIEALRLDKRGSREFMERESFKRMPNLKFLHLRAMGFAGDFEGSLSELRWLKWERCPDSFEATNVHLEKLVALDLSSDNISEKWRGWSSIKMERLKVLNLSRCFHFQSTPNLSAFKNLEMLILKQCVHLKEIDPSIGDVKRLVSLNLSYCESLEKLPEQLGELENLEELVVDKTWIKEIPPCIGSLKKLKRLSANSCYRMTEVPSSIIRLCLEQVSLALAFCRPLQQIPSSIEKLGELVELDLSWTGINELPESIGELNKLKILRISFSKIKRLPSSIGKLQSLQEFYADQCSELEGEIHVDKGGLSSLKTLRLAGTKISGLPENLDQLSSLERLDLLDCSELQSLPRPPVSLSSLWLTCRSNELPLLSHLNHLEELTLHSCMSLQSIPELPSCIRTLDVRRCPKLERLPKLSDLEFLSELGLWECDGLKELDGLEALKSLRRLNLSRGPWLGERADKLHAIRGVEKLGSLEVLDIAGRKHIQVLDLSKSEHLKELIVRNCESLVEIRCPSKFLWRFNRDGCESLKKLPDFLPHDGP
ncbi:disease resistance protein RPV1-like [Syzygium oleosum]|uniref:disease resistance protein RPV1-like n=1 Tax=Syzygium oleosum TaxID=219896 RepID=UPI0024BB56AD|nr:disease resistance protein RPV1-like [Syzygium oleosum]XP_056175602.1 disease resistance protein RPV1-like [Syzygium oleosum]XP_056175603.1 disease resistance protein RPV1-like [Syzygium oleosum]